MTYDTDNSRQTYQEPQTSPGPQTHPESRTHAEPRTHSESQTHPEPRTQPTRHDRSTQRPDHQRGRSSDAWPKPAVAHLGEIATRLERGPGLLVATDFDGTLAPIAEDPDRPQITAANATALGALAARTDAAVAVVSGRELADLRSRTGIPDAIYAGNHGLELARGAESVLHPESRRHRPALDRAARALGRALGDVPGCQIEDKRLSLTVHYRRVPTERQPVVIDRIESLAPELDDRLELVSGRKSVEVRPRIDWDKGQAVRWILATLPDGYRTVYLGDDTTDEDVFRALTAGDVGVHVGSRDTAAEYSLASQRDVAPFLGWLARRVVPGG